MKSPWALMTMAFILGSLVTTSALTFSEWYHGQDCCDTCNFRPVPR